MHNSNYHVNAYQPQGGEMHEMVAEDWFFSGSDPKSHRVGPSRCK